MPVRMARLYGKKPVVVLFHGVGGLGGVGSPVHEWSRVLNEVGIGTFAVDSFSGRGVATLAERAKVSPITRVVDAYRALELIAMHPLVRSSAA